mmetsp:Transcript_25414/g.39047  ORF Transcript_25414/g.39047 Transcript_25414/m.39047 type:complete len:159 (-) Transcript_25414:31-507(-)
MRIGIIASILAFLSPCVVQAESPAMTPPPTQSPLCEDPIDLLTARITALEEHSRKTCIGSTSTPTSWVDFKGQGASVTIDTSHCGFTAADNVQYYTSIKGTSHHWTAQGVSAIYNQSYNGLTVYVYSTQGIRDSLMFANKYSWEIQYIGMVGTPTAVP